MDVIVLLAMGGALILHEYLAGAVIALMVAGGRGLEDFAVSRARSELSALLRRTPRIVHRYEEDVIMSAEIKTVRCGDVLMVKPGEVVPMDGIVVATAAVLELDIAHMVTVLGRHLAELPDGRTATKIYAT